ncbi:pyrroline-5-carboxylate reductase [Solibacillus sp. CAU 1738]|uniref:pyrroline-5-carboxylate reductase n=1 Tax=Solibacillus sp. CAU 1738 TaxID=3140363 RepID=UPI003260B7C6
MKYGFIGLGNMSSAIIKGMIASNLFEATSIYGMNRTKSKTDKLVAEQGINACDTIEQLVKTVDVIVLGVKPQMLPDVLPTIREHLRNNHIVISLAAGKTLDYLQQNLYEDTTIFRVMPNINAMIGSSTSSYTTNSSTSSEHKQLVERLFSTVGSIVELPEHLFSIFTTIGCASPAFTYLYIDSLARAAVREGMPKQMALEIAASSVLGSAQMVLQSDEHPWALIDQVCSPGGTTIQGITSLQINHFESTIYDAVAAVTNKDRSFK